MTDRLLISQREACRRLGVSRPTLVGEIKVGRLRYVLVGKRRKFRPIDLETYVERQAQGWDGKSTRQNRRRTVASSIRHAEIGLNEAVRLAQEKFSRSQ